LAGSLTLIDAPAGLDADSLRAAASVDIVALVVEYGRTSYRDLTAAGQMLAEVTGAELAVIGVQPSAKG
jgi:MinD superfamily P-loop ATPase